MSRYVELQVTTHFSFLRGASACDELFAAAAMLGVPALGVVDRNSVAGMVRAWEASKATSVRLIPGCRLDLACGTSLLVYASSFMKCHHPDVFCAALLNAQPMGFYAPAQIVRDARAHGVEVRPPCINASRWDCTLEPTGSALRAVRLGLRMARGLSNVHCASIVGARGVLPFESVDEVWRRSAVPRAAIEKLADADAFHALAHDRRQALWKVRGLGEAPLPLFAAADEREAKCSPEGMEEDVALRPLTEGREVVEDYRTIQLSLRKHPLSFLRDDLQRRGIVTCADLEQIKDGRVVEVAGVILVRQKPGSAKGILFITIEDETGVANGILWPDRFEAQRRTVLSSAMIGMRGRVQKEGIVIHIIIDKIVDYTPLLRSIGQTAFPHRPNPGDGASNGGGPDPREPVWPKSHDGYYKPFDEEALAQKTRDFR